MALFLIELRKLEDVEALRSMAWPQEVTFTCRLAPADLFGAEGAARRTVFRSGTRLEGRWDPATGRIDTDAPLIEQISLALQGEDETLSSLEGDVLTVSTTVESLEAIGPWIQRLMHRLPLELTLATAVGVSVLELRLRCGKEERPIVLTGVPLSVKITDTTSMANDLHRGLKGALLNDPPHPRLQVALFHYRQALRLRSDNHQFHFHAIIRHLVTCVLTLLGRNPEKTRTFIEEIGLERTWVEEYLLPLISIEAECRALPPCHRPLSSEEQRDLNAFTITSCNQVGKLLRTIRSLDEKQRAKLPPLKKDDPTSRGHLFDRMRVYCGKKPRKQLPKVQEVTRSIARNKEESQEEAD